MALKWFVGSGVRVDKQAMSHSPPLESPLPPAKKKGKKGHHPTPPLSAICNCRRADSQMGFGEYART